MMGDHLYTCILCNASVPNNPGNRKKHDEGKKHRQRVAKHMGESEQRINFVTAQPWAAGMPLQQAIPLPIVPSQLQGGGGVAIASKPTAEETFSEPDFVSLREAGNNNPLYAQVSTPDHQLKVTLHIQGVVINLSSVYSLGVLDMLTQALRSSGVDLSGADLSQANISVQIDLGRNAPAATVDTSTERPGGRAAPRKCARKRARKCALDVENGEGALSPIHSAQDKRKQHQQAGDRAGWSAHVVSKHKQNVAHIPIGDNQSLGAEPKKKKQKKNKNKKNKKKPALAAVDENCLAVATSGAGGIAVANPGAPFPGQYQPSWGGSPSFPSMFGPMNNCMLNINLLEPAQFQNLLRIPPLTLTQLDIVEPEPASKRLKTEAPEP